MTTTVTTSTPPTPTPTPTLTTTRTRSLWRSRIGAALRTAVACSIVGCITLFGPKPLKRQVAFPALSYVTVILIVWEATLGDTVRGCWYAVCASFQGVLPAFLSLWLLGPARSSVSASVLAVTLSAFVISLPESTHFICKRITLAQIVMSYAVTSIGGVHTGVFTHPGHVLASTVAGALSALLALLVPYPRLASFEVKKKKMLFNENISERLNLFVEAFCAENKNSAHASISQAKSMAKTGTTLLQSIKMKQESMNWERPLNRLAKQYNMNPAERLQAMEVPLKGIEIALTSITSFPVRIADQELKPLLLSLKEKISATLKHSKDYVPSDSSTAPETKVEEEVQNNLFLQTLQTFPTQSDLSSFFFLFCMKLFNDASMFTRSDHVVPENNPTPKIEEELNTKKSVFRSWLVGGISTARVMLAFKCSLSLGLAVLFGMIYNKENGFWAGLTVGVGMSFGREATFKVANIKAQGTVLGSIYGVLGCFIFQRFLEIRFLSLLPWIIFTSFLSRSRMYSQAGGVSAIIAALIILGRKNYGRPSEFAITRITEAFIGLGCSITVELLLQPTRASTMAKIQLSHSLRKLHGFIGSMNFEEDNKNKQIKCLKEVRNSISELGKFITEAEVEPNFWFLPFNSVCYGKLLGSLSKMVELSHFATHAIGFLVEESDMLQEYLGLDLDHFMRMVVSSLKCFDEITLIKSLATLEKEIKKKNNISHDVELGMGKSSTNYVYDYRVLLNGDDKLEKIVNSFVQHSRELVDALEEGGKEEHKEQMVLCLSTLGYCIRDLMKETKEIEKCVKELLQWENPSCNINLTEIYCKITTAS